MVMVKALVSRKLLATELAKELRLKVLDIALLQRRPSGLPMQSACHARLPAALTI